MFFIKEKSEDMKIEEAFRVKEEDTEEQTGSFSFSNFFLGFSSFHSYGAQHITCRNKIVG